VGPQAALDIPPSETTLATHLGSMAKGRSGRRPPWDLPPANAGFSAACPPETPSKLPGLDIPPNNPRAALAGPRRVDVLVHTCLATVTDLGEITPSHSGISKS
jgi:hypothetical protein